MKNRRNTKFYKKDGINRPLQLVTSDETVQNAYIIGVVLLLSFLMLLLASFCYSQEQIYKSDSSDNKMSGGFSAKQDHSVDALSQAGINKLGGRLLLDRYVEITQGLQADKYIDLVGISTPTATLASNHSNLWLNNTQKALCTRFDDGTSGCLALGSAITGFLTTSSATATYLQLSSATATYLQSTSAAATYLTLSSATATYLQASSATATYLLQSSATATYAQLKGTQTFSGGNTFSSATFSAAPAITTLTNTVLAVDGNHVIISTTVSAAAGLYGPFQAVISSVTIANETTTSLTYQTSSISKSITPTASSHKIKISVFATASNSNGAGDRLCVTIFRDSTDLGPTGCGFTSLQSGVSTNAPLSMGYIDSPATTSAVTYTVKYRSVTGAGTVGLQSNSASVMILEEIL